VGKQAEKVVRWKEVGRIEREEEEQRRVSRRWVKDAMDIGEDGSDDVFEESEDDENDTEDIKVCALTQVFPFIIIYTSFHRLVANT
jgi:protein SMG6